MTGRAGEVAALRAKIAAATAHKNAGHAGRWETCRRCAPLGGFVPVSEAIAAAVEDVQAGRAVRRRP